MSVSIVVFNSTSSNNTGFFDAATYFFSQLPELNDKGLIGYFDLQPSDANSTSSPMTFYGLMYMLSSSDDLHAAIDPVLAKLNVTKDVTLSVLNPQFPDFEVFRETVMVCAPVGMNYIAGSWLWDATALKNKTGFQHVEQVFASDWLQGAMVSGPGVHAKGTELNAASPAWRKTIVHMSK